MAKYATVAVDSAGELARLAFSWTMKKTAKDLEKIRTPQEYPGATERLNMIVRRAKNLRDKLGMHVVFIAHDDIQRVYAKGGMIGAKGEGVPQPISVKGWPDIPGNTAPGEFCRAANNVLHVRRLNGKLVWCARIESLGPGAGDWEVKDHFGANFIESGYLPPNFQEIERLAKANAQCNWRPPYIWVIYGTFGTEKTRSLRFFPRPIKIFDLDGGTVSIPDTDRDQMDIVRYDSEEYTDYERFTKDWESLHVG